MKEKIDFILTGKFGESKDRELLKNYTTFHIGGEADILVKPNTEKDIVELVKYCKENDIPTTIIGAGSNILVSDKGIRGVVIVLRENFSKVSVEEDFLIAESGALLREASKKSFESSLTGMEAVSGIPGSVGGAIAMNAGAYGTEMIDIVYSVRCLDLSGNIFEYSNSEMKFSYRKSLASEKNLIVLSVKFKLKKGNKDEIYSKFEEFDYKRASRQPLDRYSAGSTFKRPEGYFASKLIDDAGLRGFTIGEAQVSEKHAGFLINIENSTCENMLKLIEEVQKIVYEKSGVRLEKEVKLIGEK